MSIQVYNRFVSILTVLTLVVALLLAVPQVRRWVRSNGLAGWGPWSAWLVAFACTAGSLIYSEFYGLEPCRLCWYQRIAMYPLVLVMGVGLWRRDPGVRWYALPQTVIGAVIAAYHYLVQNFPDLQAGGACSLTVPCSARYVSEFGFVSIPLMALAGFAAIALLSTLPIQEKS